jgi:hypothetical protein
VDESSLSAATCLLDRGCLPNTTFAAWWPGWSAKAWPRAHRAESHDSVLGRKNSAPYATVLSARHRAKVVRRAAREREPLNVEEDPNLLAHSTIALGVRVRGKFLALPR